MSKPPRSTPATRDTSEAQPLLARIVDTPQLARLIPRLPPDTLHRLITHCGLEDCAELVAVVSPAQLNAVLDIDLWRSKRAGHDEQLDPERFGTWLEVLLETGSDRAAHTLAQLETAVVTAGFAAHIRVFDPAAVSPMEIDGEEVAPRDSGEEARCEIGGYVIVARRTEAWDAVVAALVALDAEETDWFHEVMRGCRELSNEGRELDGLDNLMGDSEQRAFDLADARRLRREQQGYVTAADARAFLELARRSPATAGARISSFATPHVHAFSDFAEPGDRPEPNDGARAVDATRSEPAPASMVTMDALVDLLAEAGVVPAPPRALLAGSHDRTSDTALLEAQLQMASERSEEAFAQRSQELAFLANALIAGCSIQGRPFTSDEASRAASAVCNLGLENWVRQHHLGAAEPAPRTSLPHGLPDGFLVEHDLVSVFAVGWRLLYVEVSLHAGRALVALLDSLSCSDRDIQVGLRLLRHRMAQQLAAGTPWRAGEALDVIMMLDAPAWAGLVGLVAEYPVLHGAAAPSGATPALTIDPAAFVLIADNTAIARVHAFMRSLPEMIRG